MDDIIASVAWQCGDKACTQQWHQANYWIYGGKKRATYSVDLYGDGDHSDCKAREVPTAKKIDESWLEYAKYVARTGLDPLHNYMVARETREDQRWEFKVAPSILGVVLVQARRARKLVDRRDLPKGVVDYLNLDAGFCLGDFENWADFSLALPEVKANQWFVQSINVRTPRPAERVAGDLKAAARAHLRRASTNLRS